MRAYYFGCCGEKGHYWFAPGPQKPYDRDPIGFELDGVFAPPGSQTNGPAQLVYLNGANRTWTVIAFWDNTVDQRGASNSAFALEGVLTFEQAVRQAQKLFPTIWARFPFTVTRWDPAALPSTQPTPERKP